MDAAIGLAAEFLRCQEAHNLRSAGKALSASLPLVERSSTDSRICEHAQLGLAANDQDVKVIVGLTVETLLGSRGLSLAPLWE